MRLITVTEHWSNGHEATHYVNPEYIECIKEDKDGYILCLNTQFIRITMKEKAKLISQLIGLNPKIHNDGLR